MNMSEYLEPSILDKIEKAHWSKKLILIIVAFILFYKAYVTVTGSRKNSLWYFQWAIISLKLTNLINWSWIWILSPCWMFISFVIYLIGFIFIVEMSDTFIKGNHSLLPLIFGWTWLAIPIVSGTIVLVAYLKDKACKAKEKPDFSWDF